MSLQTTFRDVSKPTTVSKSAAPAGGVLVLEGGTLFLFSVDAVTTYTSLSGHEYLVDGQALVFENRHATNDLILNIGAFSRTIPAGYKSDLYYDLGGLTFKDVGSDWELKAIDAAVTQNASDISDEVTNRTNEDLTFLKIDGTRAMTANLDFGTFRASNIGDSALDTDAVSRGELNTDITALEALISAASSDLNWRPVVDVITEFTVGSIPANGEIAADSTFGAGLPRLFEDDEGVSPFVLASFAVDQYVAFVDGNGLLEPKLMVLRDNAAVKTWYDHTQAAGPLELGRDQIAESDTFIVKNDLMDSPDTHENTAIYHAATGVPLSMIKIGDVDWDQATGITLSGGYAFSAGVVAVADSVEAAIQKLDGNVRANATAIGTNTTDIGTNATAISDHAIDLAAVDTPAKGANLIGIQDVQTQFTASTVEGALDELKDDLEAHVTLTASTTISEGASLTGINDVGNIITASTVEGALQENRAQIDTNETNIGTNTTDIGTNTTDIGTNLTAIGNNAQAIIDHASDLAAITPGLGASLVGVEDLAGNFTGSTVEAALAELATATAGLTLVSHIRGLHEAVATGATSLSLATDFKDAIGGSLVDMSDATLLNAWVVRDGAVLVGGVGFTIAGVTLTFTAAGGGELLADEVIEVRIVKIS